MTTWLEATHKYMRLKTAACTVAARLSGCAYLVGSALHAQSRPRDVDVRIVLPDAHFKERYGLTVAEWQWQARICEWSEARWAWYHEQERYGIMIAGACGERTIDLGILPEILWQAVYVQSPHEQWGAWSPSLEIQGVLRKLSSLSPSLEPSLLSESSEGDNEGKKEAY